MRLFIQTYEEAMLPLERSPRYRSYMLRCWEEQSAPAESATLWRFSLEDPRTGKRLGFASISALLEFLQQELSGPAAPLQAPD